MDSETIRRRVISELARRRAGLKFHLMILRLAAPKVFLHLATMLALSSAHAAESLTTSGSAEGLELDCHGGQRFQDEDAVHPNE